MTSKYNQMDFFNGQMVLVLSALFGGAASLIRSFSRGETWRKAIIQAGLAFVICFALAAGLQYYTDLPTSLIGGMSGVAGLVCDRIILHIEHITDAAADEAIEKIRGEKEASKEPLPDEDDEFYKKN